MFTRFMRNISISLLPHRLCGPKLGFALRYPSFARVRRIGRLFFMAMTFPVQFNIRSDYIATAFCDHHIDFQIDW